MVTPDPERETWVWIFNGNTNHFPSAVFSSEERALAWVRAHGLKGTLTRYPLDISVYDWVVAQGFWDPKRDDQKTPDFIADFSSAHTGHHHFQAEDDDTA